MSSKTNATDLLKTKRFKLESYFLQHKVSLIFRWFIQIIVLTPKHRRKAVVSRHSPLLLLTVPGQSYVNKMWTVLDRNLISSVKHSWISCRYRKITVLTINADKKRRRAAIRRYVCFSLVGICRRRNRLVWAIRRRFPFKIYMNRCRLIPASRNKSKTGGKTPFSAFFWRAQKDIFGRFSPLYLRTWNEGGHIHTVRKFYRQNHWP